MPRCPNGSRRNKKTGNCDKIKKTSKKPKKVCPKGSKLNLKTNRCNKIKKSVKKCPEGKILNLKTNRCIKNTTANKKKYNLPGIIKSLPSLINPPVDNPSPYSLNYQIIDSKCSEYQKIKSCDVSKIKLEKNPSEHTNKPFKIMYNNSEFTMVKFLNKGAYGEVYRYANSDYEVALKTYLKSTDSEIKTIRMLKKMKVPCNLINIKLLKFDKQYMSVMDLMNGSLSEIGNKVNDKNILKVIKKIAINLNCLNSNNLSYTDLKVANILFKCLDNDEIKIVLGDVGGICEKGKQNAATWLPWEFRYLKGYPRCNEKTMVWCLGIVLFQMLKFNTDPFHWSEVYKLNQVDITKIINHYCSSDKLKNLEGCKVNISNLVKSMLELKPENRVKLKTIIDNII
jgi:hypothetical protein